MHLYDNNLIAFVKSLENTGRFSKSKNICHYYTLQITIYVNTTSSITNHTK